MQIKWIHSDEPLLIEEALTPIRQAARKAGFTRTIFQVDHHFDWNECLDAAQSLTLFSTKTFIELRLSKPALSDPGKKALEALTQDPTQDVQVVLTSPRLPTTVTKAKWFQHLAKAIDVQVIWPLKAPQYLQWLTRHAQSMQLNLNPAIIKVIAEHTEGNLLAGKQALERLSLTAENLPQTVEDYLAHSHEASIYTVYDLVDAAKARQSAKVVHIFHQLIQSDTPLPIILWAIHRESAAREKYATLIAKADQAIKGALPDNPKNLLLDLYLAFSSATIKV